MGVSAMLMLPLLLLGISGLLFIYQEVSRLWSKSAVQNKVVVITDAISGLGKGKLALPPLVQTPERWEGARAVFLPRVCHYSASVFSLGGCSFLS